MTLKQIPFNIDKIKPDAEKPQEWVRYANGEPAWILRTRPSLLGREELPILSMDKMGNIYWHDKLGGCTESAYPQRMLAMFAPDLVGHLPKPTEDEMYHVPENWEGELPEIPSGYRLAYKSEMDGKRHEGSRFWSLHEGIWNHIEGHASHHQKCLIIVPIQKSGEISVKLEYAGKSKPMPLESEPPQDLGLYRFFLDNGKLKMEEVEG